MLSRVMEITETKIENFRNGCLGRMELMAGIGKSRNGDSHEVLYVIWYITLYMHFFDKNKSLVYWSLDHKDKKQHEIKQVEGESWIL